MSSSPDFEADVSSMSDSDVFSYDSSSELYVPASELSSNADDIETPASESAESTCQPDSSRVGTSRMDYDRDSDDSSKSGCWSQLFDNQSDLDVFPESEDPLLTDDVTDPLGMDTPLYPGSQFSVVESMLMVLRFSLRLKLNYHGRFNCV